MNNFLPNCQWQLWSALVYGGNPITKQNEPGTASQAAVSCSGFVAGSPGPAFYTNDTKQLKVGDLVVISGSVFKWGFGGVGYVSTPTAVRVHALVPNSYFVVHGPLGGAGVSPTVSAAVTATPICAGDVGSGLGYCADHWHKTGLLTVWADDFTSNSCVGAIRTLGIRKGNSVPEIIEWQCPANELKKYRGRTVTFGMLVRQKVQGGAGTWNLCAVDNVTGSTNSATGAGSSYSDATYGGFEFVSVTAVVSKTATSFRLVLQLNGALGDVYYAALPTAVLGSNLSVEDCGQNPQEEIRAFAHWNPPLLTPLAQTFSTVYFPGAPGLYGWSGIDLEAISHGTCHNSVSAVACKIEFTSPTVGASLFCGHELPDPLIFGPQAVTQVAGVMSIGQGWLPLKEDGTFTLFTGQQGLVITNATFDFDSVRA